MFSGSNLFTILINVNYLTNFSCSSRRHFGKLSTGLGGEDAAESIKIGIAGWDPHSPFPLVDLLHAKEKVLGR